MPITFYNADHTISATVGFDTYGDFDSVCFAEALSLSCNVFLVSDLLVGFFEDAHVTKDLRHINIEIDQARRVGNRVFIIEVREHSGYVVRIKPCCKPCCSFDSRYEGVIIVRGAEWKKHFSPIFTSAFVERSLARVAQWATAWCNGEVYEIVHDDCILGPYLTEEEAEEALRDEFPELVFKDEDFHCECIYTLKSDAVSRLRKLSAASSC